MFRHARYQRRWYYKSPLSAQISWRSKANIFSQLLNEVLYSEPEMSSIVRILSRLLMSVLMFSIGKRSYRWWVSPQSVRCKYICPDMVSHYCTANRAILSLTRHSATFPLKHGECGKFYSRNSEVNYFWQLARFLEPRFRSIRYLVTAEYFLSVHPSIFALSMIRSKSVCSQSGF